MKTKWHGQTAVKMFGLADWSAVWLAGISSSLPPLRFANALHVKLLPALGLVMGILLFAGSALGQIIFERETATVWVNVFDGGQGLFTNLPCSISLNANSVQGDSASSSANGNVSPDSLHWTGSGSVSLLSSKTSLPSGSSSIEIRGNFTETLRIRASGTITFNGGEDNSFHSIILNFPLPFGSHIFTNSGSFNVEGVIQSGLFVFVTDFRPMSLVESGANSSFTFDLQFDPCYTLMADQVLYAPPGQCSAAAVYPYPTISGYCGAVSNVLVSPAPGTLLAPGNYTGTCTVNFTNGSSDQTQFKITVHPGFQPPDVVRYSYGVKCAGVTLQEAQPIQVFYPAAVAPTNCGSYSNFVYSIPSGSVFPLGTNVVTVTATDGNGNSVTEPFNVIVRPSYGICDSDRLTNPAEDCDGDGMPDWAEQIAGTGVCDSNSVFRLSPVTVTNGDVWVWFPAIGGNKYQLLSAPFTGGLVLSSFLPVGDLYTDASPVLHLTNLVHVGGATNSAGRAYRVQITQ